MRLFHISEEPDIRLFEPRPVSIDIYGITDEVVWALDEEHLPNYLLPRDCPRICYHRDEWTSDEDADRFFKGSKASRIITVEKKWIERLREQVIYRYELDHSGFHLIDETAGYYISRAPVVPLSVQMIDDIPSELLKFDVELRALHSLWDLREAVIASTLGYSIIRMRNAAPPPDVSKKYHPLP
jgi:hypothetical protein